MRSDKYIILGLAAILLYMVYMDTRKTKVIVTKKESTNDIDLIREEKEIEEPVTITKTGVVRPILMSVKLEDSTSDYKSNKQIIGFVKG